MENVNNKASVAVKRSDNNSGNSTTTKKKVITKISIKPITSYEIFILSIQRAKNHLKIHSTAHGKQAKPEPFLADTHRAAIVLSISALDAFVRSFVISRVRDVLADKKKPLENCLEEKIKSHIKIDGLLAAARNDDLHTRVEKAFRSDFEKKSFQGTKSISECIQFVGIKDVFHEVAIKAKMNEDTLREDLDRYTKRRHIIAHCGDYDLEQNPPVENKITKKEVQDCIKLVSVIAKTIHSIEV